jgi:hypothetical protein
MYMHVEARSCRCAYAAADLFFFDHSIFSQLFPLHTWFNLTWHLCVAQDGGASFHTVTEQSNRTVDFSTSSTVSSLFLWLSHMSFGKPPGIQASSSPSLQSTRRYSTFHAAESGPTGLMSPTKRASFSNGSSESEVERSVPFKRRPLVAKEL